MYPVASTPGSLRPVTYLDVVQGDITAQQVDAVVNAANERLAHGGGVAAAIVRAGGRVIQDESDAWVRRHGPLRPGQAAVTSGGALPARWVIHVVGPRYREGQDNEGLLRRAVTAALDAAADVGAESVAFPAISAGIFGYPTDEATRVIVSAIRDWVDLHPNTLRTVLLVGFDATTADAFRRAVDGT